MSGKAGDTRENGKSRGIDYHPKDWNERPWLDSDVQFKIPLHDAITANAKKQNWIHGSHWRQAVRMTWLKSRAFQ